MRQLPVTTTTSLSELPDVEQAQGLFMLPEEVSAALHLSRADLRRMRDAGTGPAYFSIFSTIRYLPADVDAWRRHARQASVEIDSREAGGTS